MKDKLKNVRSIFSNQANFEHELFEQKIILEVVNDVNGVYKFSEKRLHFEVLNKLSIKVQQAIIEFITQLEDRLDNPSDIVSRRHYFIEHHEMLVEFALSIRILSNRYYRENDKNFREQMLNILKKGEFNHNVNNVDEYIKDITRFMLDSQPIILELEVLIDNTDINDLTFSALDNLYLNMCNLSHTLLNVGNRLGLGVFPLEGNDELVRIKKDHQQLKHLLDDALAKARVKNEGKRQKINEKVSTVFSVFVDYERISDEDFKFLCEETIAFILNDQTVPDKLTRTIKFTKKVKMEELRYIFNKLFKELKGIDIPREVFFNFMIYIFPDFFKVDERASLNRHFATKPSYFFWEEKS